MNAPSSEIGIACVQRTPQRGRPEANLASTLEGIRDAARGGHDLVVLPELAVSGYAFMNRAEAWSAAEEVPDGATCRAWQAAARQHRVWVIGGLVERTPHGIYDTAVLIDRDGTLLAGYQKVHLWSMEHLWFERGTRPSDVVTLPFGRLAMGICFDLWVPELFRYYAMHGADLVCLPSNWSAPAVVGGGDRPIVDHLAISSAHVNSMYIAGADRAGTDGRFTFLGASLIVNPRGETVARAPQPAPDEAIVSARVDLMEARMRKTWSRFSRALDVDTAMFVAPGESRRHVGSNGSSQLTARELPPDDETLPTWGNP